MNKTTAPHIITLVLAASLGPLAMNVFLPSLPGMTEFFAVSPAVAQLSVSIYLFAVAALHLLTGPLSDKFGRRPIIIYAFMVMILGTIICIYATTIEWFLFGRVLQGFSSAGLVLSRAIARDISEDSETVRLIAYITMGMSMAPMLGPVIGGYLDEFYGWQASFYLTLGFAILALLLIYFDLGETNKHKHSSLSSQITEYPELLRSRRFWGYTFSATFSSGAFFIFLGGGPLVADKVFGLSPAEYGLYFMFVSIGYFLGNYVTSKISHQITPPKMIVLGNIVAAAGLSIAVFIEYAGYISPIIFFGFVFFVGFGNGISLPSANAGVVSARPKLAGSASGLAGSIQLGGGGLLAMIAGNIISLESGSITLTLMMLVSLICAYIISLYVVRVEKEFLTESKVSE